MIDLTLYKPQPKRFMDTPAGTAAKILIGLSALRMGLTYATSDLGPGGRNDLGRIAREAEAGNHTDVNGQVGDLVSPFSTRLPSHGYIGPDGKLYAMHGKVPR